MKSIVANRVEQELGKICDPALVAAIRRLLVTPYSVDRDWNYGAPGEKYACWSVLEHPPSNTGIAYCEMGFGPQYPWGLVALSGDFMDIGMDSGWYANLEDAMRESCAWEFPNPPNHEIA